MSEYKISIEEIKEALKRSGYLLERRVSNMFRSLDYQPVNSPTYIDIETQKKREYDVDAFKYLELNEFRYTIRFICECKNNALPVVFFEDDISYTTYANSINTSCQPEVIATTLNRLGKVEQDEFLVSTQYCTFKDVNSKRRNQQKYEPDWIAFHEDQQYEAFNQILKASQYQIDRSRRTLSISTIGNRDIEIIYPLMIFQGELYSLLNNEGASLEINSINHTAYRFLEIGRSVNRHTPFFVDIVTENYLVDFVRTKEEEAKKIITLIEEDVDRFDDLFNRKRISLMQV